MADFPKKQQQCLIPKYLLDYTNELNKNHPDPTDPWGGSGGDVNIEAGTGITITTESDDTKVISLDTTPNTFEVTADTGMTLEVTNQNPLWKDSKLQMSSAGATRLEGTQISLEANNIYLNSDSAPYYVNNTTHEYKTIATTDQIPDAVSGTNDGTNWTSLTIGNDTYGLASGGTTYTAGNGIDITGSTISIDTSVVAELSDIPDVSNMVTTDTSQTITGQKTFSNGTTFNNAVTVNGNLTVDNGYVITAPWYYTNSSYITRDSIDNTNYTSYSNHVINQGISGNNYAILLPANDGTMALTSDIITSYNDLTDKPTIPTKTSDLTNDSGFITNSDIPTNIYYYKSLSSSGGTLSTDDLNAIKANPKKYILTINQEQTNTLYYFFYVNESATTITYKTPLYTDTADSYTYVEYKRFSIIINKTTGVYSISDSANSNTVNRRIQLGTGLTGSYNVSLGYETISVDTSTVAMQSDIPTATSQLTNDSGFITAAQLPDSVEILEITLPYPSYTYTLTSDELAKVQAGCIILYHREVAGTDLGSYSYPRGNFALYNAYMYDDIPYALSNSLTNIGPSIGNKGLQITSAGVVTYRYEDVQLAVVARTGSYNDLSNTPTVPTTATSTVTASTDTVVSGVTGTTTTVVSGVTYTPATETLVFTYTDNTTATITLLTSATTVTSATATVLDSVSSSTTTVMTGATVTTTLS